MAMPAYSDHPEAYGMPATKPDYRRNYRKKPVIRPADKPVMLERYDSTLVTPLLDIPGLELNPASLKGQAEPEFIKAPFERILIDHNSQRQLKQSNLTLIEFAINNFEFTRVKVPNGIISPKGKIYLTDGQSTALIHYNHPELRVRGYVPVYVARVSERDFVAKCAQAFVALNECHIPVPRADRFTASLTARDPEALAMAEVFKATGLRITGEAKAENKYAAGETRLIQTLQRLHRSRGQDYFEKLCRILGRSAFSPIKRIHVDALVQILDKDKGKMDEQRLVNAIRSMVDKHARNEAELMAKRRMWTAPFALAELYRKLYLKGALPL